MHFGSHCVLRQVWNESMLAEAAAVRDAMNSRGKVRASAPGPLPCSGEYRDPSVMLPSGQPSADGVEVT
jgi:hypothetical protein